MVTQLITIEQASAACLPEILELLSAADLPHEGVKEHLDGFLIARSSGRRAVGCVGLERYGDLALLRSAAVLPEYQGDGIGSRLVRRLLENAARDGVAEVVLLTTTAKSYFQAKFGFQERERDDYQKRLALSPEWNLPRCSSAVLMALKLAPPAKPKRVLILCTGNSARSQMAEGLLLREGGSAFDVYSAGVNPTAVRPEAVEVMREIGIDISGHCSKSVEEFAGQQFDFVITVCDNAKETCPVFTNGPGKAQRIHQSFEDPPAPAAADEATTLAVFRRVRDEIQEWMKRFIKQAG
jgi:arsenate reductase